MTHTVASDRAVQIPSSSGVAIVGIGVHFPGQATSPETLWHVLMEGVDVTRPVPGDRWSVDKFFDTDRSKIGKTHVCRGGFLDRIDEFDPQFFGISPREAKWLDPQQRLLLRVAYESIEDAGADLDDLSGTDVGVFMGGFTLDYQLLQNYGIHSRYELEAHSATGMMMTMLSNRVSHAFNFTGPSMSIDTACSSSLVAVHLAVQSIIRGECHMALAGGVNVMLAPNMTIAESKGGFLSPDGRCKAFDSAADGYARAEGAGVVLLKSVKRARADGDRIYAVIRGTAVSQDGRTEGITVPNGQAQQRAIRAALASAGIPARQVQYVEAHGTGTPVGDPIEARAIGSTLRPDADRVAPLLLGSVKTNLGHLEAAAGVAGLIKTALALHHRTIPPHLHLRNPNPRVPLDEFNLAIPTEVTAWPEPSGGPRCAGVNSFGFGGTNAHAVLCEAPEDVPAPAIREADADSGRPVLIPISARSTEALSELSGLMAERLRGVDSRELADVSYSAATRRTHHEHRAVVVADSPETAVDRFRSLANGHTVKGVACGSARREQPRIAFVCTGMGPQWWGMGRQLLHTEPTFRAAVERCSRELSNYTSWSLTEELLADEAASRMVRTDVAQPANFAIQLGLAALWKERGIEPDGVVGHSTGELAAQYLAGVLTFEDAVRVAYHRSRLQQTTTGTGRMLAVGLSPDTLEQAIDQAGPGIAVAAINSDSSVTVSGDAAALERMAAQLDTFGVFSKFLPVEVPYHSPRMDPLRDELLASLTDLRTRSARTPLYSTVTGTQVEGSSIDALYWWQNVRATVLFGAAFREMVEDGYTAFIELGPHPVLANSMREALADLQNNGVLLLPSLRRGDDEQTTFHASLAHLHCHGLRIDWEVLSASDAGPTRLPRYPWQLSSYWNESKEAAEDRHFQPLHPLLGQRLNAPHPTWEVEAGSTWLPGIEDHRIHGATVVPAAAFVEMIHAAAADAYCAGHYGLSDLQLHRALVLDSTTDPRIRTTLHVEDGFVEIASFQARSTGERTWTVHLTAKITRIRKASPASDSPDLHAVLPMMAGDQFYSALTEGGFDYGPAFRAIGAIGSEGDRILADLVLPDVVADDLDRYRLHPAAFDAALQVLLIAGMSGENATAGTSFLPVGIGSIQVHRRPAPAMRAVARVTGSSSRHLECDVTLTDLDGDPVLDIRGYRAQAIHAGPGQAESSDQALYEVQWEPAAEVGAWGDDLVDPADWAGAVFAIFLDRQGVGEELAVRLSRAGKKIIRISAAPTDTVEQRDDLVTMDPDNPEHYRLLAGRLAGLGVDHLLHLWALDIPEVEGTGDDVLGWQSLASASVFQAVSTMLNAADLGQSWRLWLVTRHAQPVLETDRVAPDQATLWGAGRVLGHQEIPHSWGGLIDLDDGDAATSADNIVRAALSLGDHHAFRGTTRYVARLDRIRPAGHTLPLELNPEAAFLITGGLGALGLHVARFLAERGAKHLVLMSRSGLPRGGAAAEGSRGSVAPSAIRALEQELGCTIEVAAVDVGDHAQLQRWLHERGDAPPIRGVVHAAGVVNDALVQTMSAEQFWGVLRPKIAGAWNLHTLFAEADLEFFTLFSSTGSVIASPGQSNYAAANAYLDGLASLRRSQGLPAVSLSWGPWSIGMVQDLALEDLYARLGIDLITPAMGSAVLDRYLADPPQPHSVVISVDWSKARQAAPRGVLPELFARLADEASEPQAESLAGHLAALAADEREPLILATVHELVTRVLGLDPDSVPMTDPLSGYGMDSMMALEVRNRVQVILGVEIPVLELLHGTTIAQLAAKLTALVDARMIGHGSPTADESADASELIEEEIHQLLAEASEEEIAELLGQLDLTTSHTGPKELS